MHRYLIVKNKDTVMPEFISKAKENAFNHFVSLIVSIGTVIGMFLTVDDRYAHSDEVDKLKVEQQQVIRQNRYDLQQSTGQLRKQQLQDKIFDIELMPASKQSPYDKARLEKYKSDLQDVNQILQQPAPIINNEADLKSIKKD